MIPTGGTVGREDPLSREAAAERRRHVRVEVELGVSFKIVAAGARPIVRAVTLDISHGGACLAVSGCTEELFGRLAAKPLLEIAIDGTHAVALQGRVEWLSHPADPGMPTLFGVQFNNMSAADETVIIDLIAQIRTGAAAPTPGDVSPPAGTSG